MPGSARAIASQAWQVFPPLLERHAWSMKQENHIPGAVCRGASRAVCCGRAALAGKLEGETSRCDRKRLPDDETHSDATRKTPVAIKRGVSGEDSGPAVSRSRRGHRRSAIRAHTRIRAGSMLARALSWSFKPPLGDSRVHWCHGRKWRCKVAEWSWLGGEDKRQGTPGRQRCRG